MYIYIISDKTNWNLFKSKTPEIQGYILPKSLPGLNDSETKLSSANTQKKHFR